MLLCLLGLGQAANGLVLNLLDRLSGSVLDALLFLSLHDLGTNINLFVYQYIAGHSSTAMDPVLGHLALLVAVDHCVGLLDFFHHISGLGIDTELVLPVVASAV